MDDINIFISIIFLLIIIFIGLIKAESLLGVFILFLLLTIVAYTTIYLFK